MTGCHPLVPAQISAALNTTMASAPTAAAPAPNTNTTTNSTSTTARSPDYGGLAAEVQRVKQAYAESFAAFQAANAGKVNGRDWGYGCA